MFTIADSIGIKQISPNCLLTGIGNELHQYFIDSTCKTVHKQINLNFKCKIYGISCLQSCLSNKFVIVYGGKELVILTLNVRNKFKIVQRLSINDWISSIHLYEPPTGSESTQIVFCVVSAHSVATEIVLNCDGEWKQLNKSSCVDKSTLYCSRVIGEKWSNTTVFGGTALGELIIWSTTGADGLRDVMHRLSGHNGVIFSIECALKHNLLTTTSDDRSVKIWNLNFPSEKLCDWSRCTLDSSKSMFGHTARIFSHKIIEYNGEPYIVSIGEDGNVCVWTSGGRLICRKLISEGGALWDLDYDTERWNLITCGSDGNVHQTYLKDIFDGKQYQLCTIPNPSNTDDEYVAKIKVMQQENALLIGLTNRHSLHYRYIDANRHEQAWRAIECSSEIRYKSSLLETYDNNVAIAGYQYATVYQLYDGHWQVVLNEKLSNGMIRSLKFIGDREFIVCDDRGNCTFYVMDDEISNGIAFELPVCKERWITVAMRHQNYLLIGDRCGNVHLYTIDIESGQIQICDTLKRVHGNKGCTSIYPDAVRSSNVIYFQSTGHDGTTKSIVIHEASRTLEIRFTHKIPIAWCDKQLPMQLQSRNVLLAGFNDNHFIAWQKHTDFRFEYNCGGGHRYWDLYVDNKSSIAHLFFIRSKTIHKVQFDLNTNKSHPFDITKCEWHIRPCNTVRSIRLSNDRFLLVSGGDDNLLKFNEINVAADDVKQEAIETKQQQQQHRKSLPQHIADMVLHISNIRTICTIKLSTYNDGINLTHPPPNAEERWLVFSAGGRAQICVTEIEINGQHRAIEFSEITTFMLRLNDLMRKRLGKSQLIEFDAETRFMSLIAYHTEVGTAINVVVGCSDGYIRTFRYTNSNIALVTSTFYGRCILHVHHFRFGDNNYLLTMATDGLIGFWSLDQFAEDSKPFFTVEHHESGINSFDLFIDESRMFVATGGDDQSIVISVLQLNGTDVDDNLDVIIDRTIKFPYEHTAQVNGVRFSVEESALYTVSVDQTMMRIDLVDFSIKQIAYTCVSDAKGLNIIGDGWLLVYGCGLQLLRI